MNDTTLHYGEDGRQRVTVKTIPITMRNEVELRSIATEIDAYNSGADVRTFTSRLLTAANVYPEVWDFFTEAGNWNAKTIDRMAKSLQSLVEEEHKIQVEATKEGDAPPAYEPLEYEAAVREAVKRLQGQWRDLLAGNLDLARRLYFSAGKWPVSLQGLKDGRAIVQRIIDRKAMSADDVALIDGELDTDFWGTVQAAEVAALIDTFRNGVGQ